MIKFKTYFIDIKLLLFILIFMTISIITINSSMLYLPKYLGNLALKQFIWYILGFSLIMISFFINFKNYRYSFYFYLFNILLLLFLLIIGKDINGSKCWLIIPTIGSLQPSEFMKIALIIYYSKVISNWSIKDNRNTFKNEFILLLETFIILVIPSILTFLEPDTGAVIMYIVIVFSILMVSPIRKRWIIFIILLLIIILGLFTYIYFYQQRLFISIFGSNLFYRINRIFDWKNGSGMQLENSLVAIGSSGLFGHGYKKTPIYFPESGTDFIFSVYASNFGLIGSIFLIIILTVFDLYLIRISKRKKDYFNKYIIIGATGMLIYQQMQNIGMTLGILPITGITLPFISYGGSSLLSYFIILAIIFKMNKKKY